MESTKKTKSEMAQDNQIETIKTQIVNLHLKTKELINDIQSCEGPIEVLEDLNDKGRHNISLLRNNLSHLKSFANEIVVPDIKKQLLEEIKVNENELSATLAAFKKANFTSLLAIDRANQKQLLGENQESGLKYRGKDKESLLKMSKNVTDQLISISGNLSDSVQRSADTLDTLVNSSATADGTKVELDSAGNVIAHSGKLLAKYGRREKTDKVLVISAFIFFLVCAFYITQKRLF